MTTINAEIKEKVPVKAILSAMEKGMTQVFRNYIKDVEAPNLAGEMQYQLEHASRVNTGMKFWTGTLQSSIKMLKETIRESPGNLFLKVGVDMRTPMVRTPKGKRKVSQYAAIVEKGLGRMPAAYQYTEQGLLEWQKGVGARVAAKLAIAMKEPWGYRNVATGRFVTAPK